MRMFVTALCAIISFSLLYSLTAIAISFLFDVQYIDVARNPAYVFFAFIGFGAISVCTAEEVYDMFP